MIVYEFFAVGTTDAHLFGVLSGGADIFSTYAPAAVSLHLSVIISVD